MFFIKKKSIDADILYELYIVQELSQRQVAKELGISQTQVRREMEKANIPARDANSSRKCKGSQQRTKELAQRYSEEYKIWRTNVCAYCGKEFMVDGSHKKKKYCSDECIKAAFNERATVYYCKLCGNPIIQNGIKYKRIYCDNCLGKWRSIVFSKKIITNCGYCGKEIEVIPSRYKNNQFCYCDTNCMAKHYAEIYTGENSPTWKGGKTHHYTGGFYHARKQVRERDNYTCQLCGITEEEYGKELSVHHIKKYRDFDNKIEANDLNNLISLCEPCHRFIHSNANIEQLYIQE